MTNSSMTYRFQDWLERQLVFKYMNSLLGYALIAVLILLVAAVAYLLGIQGSLALVGLLIGVPVAVACFFNLEFGVLFTVAGSFFINFMRKYSDIPFGTALDGLLVLLLVGLMYKLVKEKNFQFATNPLSIAIYIWIGYNLLEVLNPVAPTFAGWVYSVRTLAIWLSLYFVAYHAFDSLKKIQRFAWLLIIMMTIGALYGLKQEYIGFSQQEMNWLYADPLRYRLYFTWSRLRIFSFFSDPTAFGIAMAYTSVFALILATGKMNWSKRILLIAAAALMILAVGYTGSRTPVLLIAAGVFIYVLLRFSKEAILVGGVLAVLGLGLVLKSTSNPVLYRIQSAFRPNDDSSMQLRLKNQAYIQPFIQSHPFGAGLGTIGVWGKRFNSNSWLSNFAPDSAYVRVAVECGWIGLIIFLALFFIALRLSIYYYFRVKDPTIKLLYLGFTSIIFLLTIANYPQEASYMLPTNLVFNTVLAVIIRLKDFDENFQS